MIRKYHVRWASIAVALASSLEAAVDVVGGQDLTWNVIAVGISVALPHFVELLKLDEAHAKTAGTSSEE